MAVARWVVVQEEEAGHSEDALVEVVEDAGVVGVDSSPAVEDAEDAADAGAAAVVASEHFAELASVVAAIEPVAVLVAVATGLAVADTASVLLLSFDLRAIFVGPLPVPVAGDGFLVAANILRAVVYGAFPLLLPPGAFPPRHAAFLPPLPVQLLLRLV